LDGIGALGRLGTFSFQSLANIQSGGGLPARLVRSTFEIGVRCLPVITIVAAFSGLVLGLQGHYVLSRFGASEMLGTLVSLSLCRELAPVLAAIMLAGQAGTSLAAELGIQRSTEQIDAFELMGISAEGFLVGPRLLVAAFVVPALTSLFTLVGVAGGWLSGCVLLHQDANSYWAAVHQAVQPRDVFECLIKALVFGILTVALCSFQGFYSHRLGEAGARSVGAATVRGVVFSSIAVLVADYLITSILV
jgi:phospholipid/cholesterol/gamma-HCH transport system permease protein